MIHIFLALLQVFDIIIHAATNQLEALRVTANIVILLWLAANSMGWLTAKPKYAAIAAPVIYLGLNLTFLTRAGFTNNGEPRTMLFILVTLTMALSAILLSKFKPQA